MNEDIDLSAVPTTTVAQCLGISARYVHQLTEDGVFTSTLQNRKAKYDLPDTVQRYIKKLTEKADAAKTTSQRKEAAEADMKEAKAEILAMERDELRGKMHRSEDVEAMTSDLVFSIRAMMLALPGRLAIDLADMDKPAEVSERIKGEVYKILEELSKYEYSAEAYRARVRERQGWEKEAPEGDGGEQA